VGGALVARPAAEAVLRGTDAALDGFCGHDWWSARCRGTCADEYVEFALKTMARTPSAATVRELARSTDGASGGFAGVSRRGGFSPKVWSRIQRFQRRCGSCTQGGFALAELALDCGYYDQSHFANEFKAFSGIDATTYCAARGVWANQIPVS